MSVPYLKWLTPTGQEEKFPLDDREVIIGRLSGSDIVLTNPYISRQHARIIAEGGQYVVEDLSSTHGSFLNGVRISRRELKNGDRLTLGRDQIDLVFIEKEEAERFETTLGDEDLEKSMMQLTSVIPLAGTESSNLEKISHILDFQYNWERSFSPEKTFKQILDAALKLSGAERGYILLKEEPGFKYVVGLNGQGQLLSESEFQTSRTIVQEVQRKEQPVLMTENIDKAFAQQQSILAMHLRAVACIPLTWISEDSDRPEVRGILYLDSTKTMHALSGLDQKILNKLAVEAATVFEKLELIEAFEEKKVLEKELSLARETQTSLLPMELPRVAGFDVAAFSHPTRHVGGDFYDFLKRDSKALTGVLADVSGKGISAALLSSLLQGALQMEFRTMNPLHESLNMVNLYLCEKSQANRFVTLFLFGLNEDGSGEYLSAGHNPAYLYRSQTKQVEELPALDLILGAFSFAKYQAIPLQMEPGDLLVVYSDGVTEAMNPEDEMFGEDRLIELIIQKADTGSEGLHRSILSAINEFTRGMAQTDDMTFVIVQKT